MVFFAFSCFRFFSLSLSLSSFFLNYLQTNQTFIYQYESVKERICVIRTLCISTIQFAISFHVTCCDFVLLMYQISLVLAKRKF